jgi:hypothetical protein
LSRCFSICANPHKTLVDNLFFVSQRILNTPFKGKIFSQGPAQDPFEALGAGRGLNVVVGLINAPTVFGKKDPQNYIIYKLVTAVDHNFFVLYAIPIDLSCGVFAWYFCAFLDDLASGWARELVPAHIAFRRRSIQGRKMTLSGQLVHDDEEVYPRSSSVAT